MDEREDDVTIWLSKNSRWTTIEKEYFETNFASKVSAAAYTTPRQSACTESWKEELWSTMLEYQTTRIRETYCPNFQQAMSKWRENEQYQELTTRGDDYFMKLCNLYDETLAYLNPSNIHIAAPESILLTAFEIRKSESAKNSLKQEPGSKVWKWVCFLGRFRVAWESFVAASSRNQAFEKVTVVCLELIQPHGLLNKERLSLEKSLAVFPGLRSSFAEKYKHKRQLFHTYQKEDLHVHAEIQLLKIFSAYHDIFPYIGGSKKCCYFCFLFIRNYRYVDVRGCHYTVHTGWTMPDINSLPPAKSHAWYRALTDTHEQLLARLPILKHPKQGPLPQSSAAKTETNYQTEFDPTTGTEESATRRQYKASLIRQPMNKAESDRIAFLSATSQEDPHELECFSCKLVTSRTCSICGVGRFCSSLCERQYVPYHPTQCRTDRSIRSLSARCAVCGRTTSRRCASCLSSAWCSEDCYLRDRRVHDLLCDNFAFVSRALPRPHAYYKLSVLFAHDTTLPTLIWVYCKKIIDEDDGVSFESPIFDEMLGADKPIRDSRSLNWNLLKQIPLNRTIQVYFRDTFLRDGSTRNRSIVQAVGGPTPHDWLGPSVVMSQPGTQVDPLRFQDISMTDLTSVVDYFTFYREDYEEREETVSKRPGPKISAVRINCRGDMTTFGYDKCEEVKIMEDSVNDGYGSIPLNISWLLGMPLRLQHIPPDPSWREDPSSYLGSVNTPLYYNVDVNSAFWGWCDPKLTRGSYGGSVRVFREDHEPLDIQVVRDICDYCHVVLQPAFEDALGADLRRRSKAEVMKLITPAAIGKWRRGRCQKR